MNIKPFHFLHPDYTKIKEPEAFIDKVRWLYPDMKKEDLFVDLKHESLFVYRIKTKDKLYHGIIAAVDIQDYLKGMIKKHENTLTQQEDNIGNLMIERQAIIKPVLIVYNERKKIKDLIAKSFLGVRPKFKLRFEKDEQIHEFFEVQDKSFIAQFQKEFKAKVKKAYIADGHHRMASISKLLLHNPELGKESLHHIMCALFDFSELSIFPYNRLIRTGDLFSTQDVINFLAKYASVTPLKKPRKSQKKFEVILLTSSQTYSIVWNKEVILYFKQKNGIAFDMDIFNELLLHDLMNIENIRSSDRIVYYEGIKSVRSMVKSLTEKPDHTGFVFFPVRKRDFIKVADEHMVLPPKSTWFEPRIRNGIIVQDLQIGFYKM